MDILNCDSMYHDNRLVPMLFIYVNTRPGEREYIVLQLSCYYIMYK